MAFSRERYRNVFGRAQLLAGAEDLLTYEEFAGNPTGNIAPTHIGKECFDTVNLRFYKAVGMTSADWRAMTA